MSAAQGSEAFQFMEDMSSLDASEDESGEADDDEENCAPITPSLTTEVPTTPKLSTHVAPTFGQAQHTRSEERHDPSALRFMEALDEDPDCAPPLPPFSPHEIRVHAVGTPTATTNDPTLTKFCDQDSWKALYPDEDLDWTEELLEQDKIGQTFEMMVDTDAANCPKPRKKTIYILALGMWDGQADLLKFLADFLRVFFCLEVRVVRKPLVRGWKRPNPNTLNPREYDPDNVVYSSSIEGSLRALVSRMKDVFCVLGVTQHDLYMNRDVQEIFGIASTTKNYGLVSIARLLPGFPRSRSWKSLSGKTLLRFRTRLCRVVAHEMCHVFGMQHCPFWRCLVNATNSLESLDAIPTSLCPVCLKKLTHALARNKVVKVDMADRLQRLTGFFQKYTMSRDELQTGRILNYCSPKMSPAQAPAYDAGIPKPLSI